MMVNGVSVDLGSAPYYENGRFFIPLRPFFEKLGYTVEWSTEKSAIMVYTPSYDRNSEKKEFSWEFNQDNNTEGWKFANVLKAKVENGSMRISGYAKQPNMELRGQKKQCRRAYRRFLGERAYGAPKLLQG